MSDVALVGDISNLIKLKEKELHEIHDMRCHQLEQLIHDRDTLLIQAKREFEQLKGDFQYNLSLLEARDLEIRRLDGIVKNLSDQLEENQAERNELNNKLDSMELREVSRKEKMAADQVAHKVWLPT